MAKVKNPYYMPRTCQITILVLQLISTFERQIFDFLGYMWLPILGNFFNIIFVIFGLFGVYQHRVVYLFVYIIWTLVWIAYNVFIICFYFDAGDLNKQDDILSFGAGSFSWWLINSPGCRPVYNSSVPDASSVVPPRPSSVEGCYVRFEKIEVTHAAIQLVLATIGLAMGIFIIHFINSVISPQLEKQGVKAMYSIEYSPQRHESNNTLEQETNLQVENGDARGHMTPRRVKRRSYRSSTRNNKSMHRQNNRQSGRSARSSGRSHKSINPVTRLIDADQNCADSSTSNDNAYGQINQGYQSEVSRPNSIYNLSGPPTDGEGGLRPHSALTSYSNFHGQRQQPVLSTPANAEFSVKKETAVILPPQNITNLTQESLMNHNANQSLNTSYDDLPPPPPPLSLQNGDETESDATSSVATAQMPVPSIRGSTRRNEYVNIPLNKENDFQRKQRPEPQSQKGSYTPKYVNMPGDQTYGEMDRSSGSVLTYEAETLRANNSLMGGHPAGLYNEPYSVAGSESSMPWSEAQQNLTTMNGFREAEPGPSRLIENKERPAIPKPPDRSSSHQYNNHHRDEIPQKNDYATNVAGSYPDNTNKHLPRGHSAKDRASLRLKQRKEMESRAHQSKHNSEGVEEPSYYSYQQQQNKFTNGGPPSLQNHVPNHQNLNNQPKSLPNSTEAEDRWYMKDSMKPVGAATHGQTCKCYRCQRKLTAI